MITVNLDEKRLSSIQGAIEHFCRILMRHNGLPKKGRTISTFDVDYISKMVADLCEIREEMAETIEKNQEIEK